MDLLKHSIPPSPLLVLSRWCLTNICFYKSFNTLPPRLVHDHPLLTCCHCIQSAPGIPLQRWLSHHLLIITVTANMNMSMSIITVPSSNTITTLFLQQHLCLSLPHFGCPCYYHAVSPCIPKRKCCCRKEQSCCYWYLGISQSKMFVGTDNPWAWCCNAQSWSCTLWSQAACWHTWECASYSVTSHSSGVPHSDFHWHFSCANYYQRGRVLWLRKKFTISSLDWSEKSRNNHSFGTIPSSEMKEGFLSFS